MNKTVVVVVSISILSVTSILFDVNSVMGTPEVYMTSINTGDTAWVAVAAALVMLMTPALGFFYGGLVRQKNLVSTITQCFVIFALVSLVWALWAYSLAFGPTAGGLIGDLSWFGLKGVGSAPQDIYASTIPHLLFFLFQLKFAAITPALIIGAFAERIKFNALLLFTLLWTTLVYAPVAHWVWNTGGWLNAFGALDFAGGTVVHVTAGFSALAAAMVVGKRNNLEKRRFSPNNVPFVILGASLLWFGWFGFNAGSALSASPLAVNALVVTNLAASAAAISWMALDWARRGKPSATGVAVGAVCGLVSITPASGFVDVASSIVIGLVAGCISNLVSNWRASRARLDDSLDVFACHGIGGVWGALATGLFAQVAINPAGADGLVFGNPTLLGVQAVALVIVAVFAFSCSYVLLKLINSLLGLRVSKEDEDQGLDVSQLGERAYS